MKMLFKPMLAAMLVFLTTSANATPIKLEISDTFDFSGTVISAVDTDNDGRVSILSLAGDFEGWSLNMVTGISSPLIGDEHVDMLDLISLNVSGGAGTIYVRLTGAGFDGEKGLYRTAFGGTTTGLVNAQSWADDTNTEFGQGILLSDSGDISTLGFSRVDSGSISLTGPYSLSIFAAITHDAGDITSFDYFVSVPEPGTLALFGIGLFGLGLAKRRKI
jgi:hypothetical protein